MNLALVSFLAYTAVLLAIGIWSYRIVEKVPVAKYEEEFYAAGRGLGGIVVALVIAGGMASAGTFIAGPGMCYAYGYSWVLINVTQTFINLMLLAAVGIMVGLVARRVNIVTYLDIYQARYRSKAVVLLMAALVALLLIPYMSTQFVGAARTLRRPSRPFSVANRFPDPSPRFFSLTEVDGYLAAVWGRGERLVECEGGGHEAER